MTIKPELLEIMRVAKQAGFLSREMFELATRKIAARGLIGVDPPDQTPDEYVAERMKARDDITIGSPD